MENNCQMIVFIVYF